MIRKILIANRGEIAVRIIRACREMGILTVAVYSEADRDNLHTQLADEAVCIGPAPAKESYLNMEQIISAAMITGADAIHPGFGFLSENSAFARLCEACHITFIGPPSGVMEKMGNKAEARKTMQEAGVPVIPGCDEALVQAEAAFGEAKKIGFPVMIKAALGGGGKGMRVARGEEEFAREFLKAQQEARQAFGDERMYLEHFVEKPRHIEFQLLADAYGNTVHLGERDCSVQRNHQKVIEESPSPTVDEELRTRMGRAAVTAARAAGYVNAGTIEFLLEKDGRFYFMEMNTRIQVEHPVTEWVTGIDLIKAQIRIADGQKLGLSQKDIVFRGHALECRINAEDALHGFRPCSGTVTDLLFPGGKGVRIDSAVYAGYTISPWYDSMIAKLNVWGESREEALCKMRSALGEMVIGGVTTNIDFLYGLTGHEDFREGNVDISWLERILKP